MRNASWKKWLGLTSVGCTVAVGSIMSLARAADEAAKPKHTIKEVMKIAHNKESGLLAKVLSGEGTDEQKKELLDVYVSLAEGKPGKGDLDSWHTLAGGAALAAAKVVVGREGALDELKTASNCKACHDIHKGK